MLKQGRGLGLGVGRFHVLVRGGDGRRRHLGPRLNAGDLGQHLVGILLRPREFRLQRPRLVDKFVSLKEVAGVHRLVSLGHQGPRFLGVLAGRLGRGRRDVRRVHFRLRSGFKIPSRRGAGLVPAG